MLSKESWATGVTRAIPGQPIVRGREREKGNNSSPSLRAFYVPRIFLGVARNNSFDPHNVASTFRR